MIGRDPFGSLRRVFRMPPTKRRVSADIDDELRFHLEGRVDQLIASGTPRPEAEIEARRRLGDVESYRRALRAIDQEMWRMRRRLDFRDTITREIRQALRSLIRTPSFTAMAVITLALALGAATAIFTILDAVVLRPFAYPHGDRLVALSSPIPGAKAAPVWGLARHELGYFKRASHTLEDLGLYTTFAATVLGDGGPHDPERVMAANVTASLFSVLGITPEAGRLITAADNVNPDLKRSLTVGLLSHGFWQRRFGGDPTIVGKTIDLEGFPVTIVGILPPNAQLPDLKTDVWLPVFLPTEPLNNHTYRAIGRLRPGVSIAEAQHELTTLTARFGEVFPSVYTAQMLRNSGFTTRVVSLREDIVGDLVTRALWILFGGVGVVLLIAAANVGNLFLVRIESRRLEVAVRGALGASRADLAWHYVAESLLLTMGAALIAILLGALGLRVLLALAPADLPRLQEIALDWRGTVFCVACAIASGLAFGLLPTAGRRADLSLLRDSTRGGTISRRRVASRNLLIVLQMALALVLLAGAGLLVRSLRNLRQVDPGFDARGVMTFALSLPNGTYRSFTRASRFYEQVGERVRALPGVVSVGFGGELPLEASDGCTGAVIDVPGPSGARGDCVQMMQVTPGYFETLRIPVRGTLPTWSETNERAGGAMVSDAFASRFWPNESAIGHGVRCCNGKPPFYRITAVTGPVRTHGLDRAPGQVVYFPIIPIDSANPGIEESPAFMRLVVRSTGAAPTRVSAIERIVHDVDPQVPVTEAASMEELLSRSLARRSFTMVLLATTAALALLLSAVGVYGVISYVVAQRRSEIGIRMALGARTSAVRRMVVRQSLDVAAIGVMVGLLGALATTRLLSTLLFGVAPTDPLVLAAATLLLLVLAVIASYGPARRASRVDPAEALRS